MNFEVILDIGCYNKYLSVFDILVMYVLVVGGINDYLLSY